MDEIPGQGKRQKKRDSLFLSATVRIEGRRPLQTRVRNLSAGGMMIDLIDEAPTNAVLIAQIRGLDEVTGRIAWCAQGRAGVAFDREVDPRLARSAPSTGPKAVMPDFLRVEASGRPSLKRR